MKLLYVDVETTGLDRKVNSIIQLAGYYQDTTANEMIKFDYNIRPYRNDHLEPVLESKLHVKDVDVQNYPSQKEAFDKFYTLLDSHIDCYDKNDKCYFIGYNTRFDYEFVYDWFLFNSDYHSRMGSYVFFPYLDVMDLAAWYMIGKTNQLKSFKLVDVYQYLTGQPLEDAHNAFADIDATKKVLNILISKGMLAKC